MIAESRANLALVLLVIALFASTAAAQWSGGTTVGADVIVGDISGAANYSPVGAIDAFSIGTTSCNIGDTPLDWIYPANQHPVIGQNAFRLHDNRFEHIGQAWLKHGFTALNGSLCGSCTPTGASTLGVGCSDPYLAPLNGFQGAMGPKFEVNAATGVNIAPFTAVNISGDSIYKRLQVKVADLDPTTYAGALYFVEGQYVAQDDTADGNGLNNLSYRKARFDQVGPGDYDLKLESATVRGEPAINAWRAANPNVRIKSFDVPGDGRFNVGLLIIDNGDGTFRYEYAIHNETSDRSAFKFEVPTMPGATISNVTFHDVDYHSGEPFSGTDWVSNVVGGTVTWATDDFATDVNANALRWGTLYNFGFTTDTPAQDATLHLFKPGTPTSILVSFAPPAFVIGFPNGAPTELSETAATTLTVSTLNVSGAPDPATAYLHVSIDGGPFTSAPMISGAGGTFTADLPAILCGTTVDYYVTIDAVGGASTVSSPLNAPTGTYRAISATAPFVLLTDDCETDQGFTVSGNASDGHWDRGVPANWERGDPVSDSDGSGQCWLTDNNLVTPNSDVDLGSTILTSPVYDMFEMPDPYIVFDLWYVNDANENVDDTMQIEVSNGGPWVLVEDISDPTTAWIEKSIRVRDWVVPNGSVQFRLIVSDNFATSVVEAGLDNVRILACPLFAETVAAGTVGVGVGLPPQQVFRINGSNGGPLRRVAIGYGDPLTFEMQQPTTNAFSSLFIVWGVVLTPPQSFIYSIGGGIGNMLFPPCDVDPTNPALFLLTDNSGFSGCPAVLPSLGTPWISGTGAGVNFDISITLQGVIIDPSAPLSLGITNAIHLRVSSLL